MDYFEVGRSQFNLKEGKWFGYVPASIGLELSGIGNKYLNKSLTWWEEDSFFKYPVGLISSFSYLTTGHKKINLREALHLPDDYFLILDSGGYQVYSSEVGKRQQIKNLYSVEELTRFVENQGKVVSFVLDTPFTLTDATDFTLFQEKAHRTRDNNIRME